MMDVPQNVTMSVGKTWRFVTSNGAAAAAIDRSGYREQLGQLKNGTQTGIGGLPWPPYRSTLWSYWFGEGYQEMLNKVLVGSLLPLATERGYEAAPVAIVPGNDYSANPTVLTSASNEPIALLTTRDAFIHPFAITTLLHLSVIAVPDEGGRAADFFSEVLHHPQKDKPELQVRDGMPIETLGPLPEQDVDEQPAGFTPSGGFLLLSGLHTETDPGPLAYQLASLYQKTAAGKSQPMNTDRSAISITDRSVAMLLAADGSLAASRARCLHRNTATLQAYMENLATLLPATTTPSSNWFQGRAALMINSLVRRRPVPGSSSIYKSRVAEMWINHRELAATVNAINDREQAGVPALPES
jgi:hypothetical protein